MIEALENYKGKIKSAEQKIAITEMELKQMRHDYELLKEEIQQNVAKYMDIKQASRFTGYKPNTIREKVKKGEIQAYQPGGKSLRFKRKDLEEYLESNPVVSDKKFRSDILRKACL